MTGSFNKSDHLSRCMGRQRMMGDARPRRDIGCHFARKIELPIRCSSEQRDHQILQRDHANAELHQLRICQLRDLEIALLQKLNSLAGGVIPRRPRFPTSKAPLGAVVKRLRNPALYEACGAVLEYARGVIYNNQTSSHNSGREFDILW